MTVRQTSKRRRYGSLEDLRGIEYLREVKRIRDSYPLPQTFGELWEGSKLKPQYQEHGPAARVITKHHAKANGKVPPSVIAKLTPGLRQAMRMPPDFSQIHNKYPWMVKWVRVDAEGHRRNGVKSFTTLGGAIAFWAKVSPRVPTATVVSRLRSYDIPTDLRGRLPKGWHWCPRCMKPRKFIKDSERTFVVLKKVYNKTKGYYEFKERTVAYLTCPLCRCTNRDGAWRRSNQPWEVRRFKKGVRRARRRRTK